MRLGYFMNMRMPTEKAHGIQVMKMCEAFASQGVEVRLFVSNRRTHIKGSAFEYYGVQPEFRISYLATLDFVDYGALGFYIQTLTFLASAFFAILFLRPDTVYTRDPWVALLAQLCLIKRVCWEIHTAQPIWICRVVGACVTSLIPISGGLKEHLEQSGVRSTKIHIEHDGADLDEFARLPSREMARTALSLPQDRLIIGYVGKLTTMGEQKGVEEIIQAVGELKRELPTLFMLVVGVNDSERAVAEGIVQAAGLSETDVLLVPHVPRNRIPAYLRAASVLVMNYPNTPHYARMMSPLKLFEYMASKTPIVSSDLPSIREVLTDESAFLCAPDSPDGLRQEIRRAATEPTEAATRAHRAASIVEKYTWDSRARRILQRLAV